MEANLPKNINIGIPPQLSAHRNTLFEVGLLIIVCGLFYWFIIAPKQAALSVVNESLNQFLQQQSQTSDNLKTFNGLVDKLKSHPTEIKELDDAIPLQGKSIYFQMLLDTLVSQSGVTVGNVSVAGQSDGVIAGDAELINNPFKAKRTLKKMTGNIYVTGTFSQLESFLRKVETSGRLLQVTSILIGPGQDGNLSLNLNLQAYYFAP